MLFVRTVSFLARGDTEAAVSQTKLFHVFAQDRTGTVRPGTQEMGHISTGVTEIAGASWPALEKAAIRGNEKNRQSAACDPNENKPGLQIFLSGGVVQYGIYEEQFAYTTLQ
jgi:hypothetical protein